MAKDFNPYVTTNELQGKFEEDFDNNGYQDVDLHDGDKIHVYDKESSRNRTFTVHENPFTNEDGKKKNLYSLEDSKGDALADITMNEGDKLQASNVDNMLNGEVYPVEKGMDYNDKRLKNIVDSPTLDAVTKANPSGEFVDIYAKQKDGSYEHRIAEDTSFAKKFSFDGITRNGKELYSPRINQQAKYAKERLNDTTKSMSPDYEKMLKANINPDTIKNNRKLYLASAIKNLDKDDELLNDDYQPDLSSNVDQDAKNATVVKHDEVSPQNLKLTRYAATEKEPYGSFALTAMDGGADIGPVKKDEFDANSTTGRYIPTSEKAKKDFIHKFNKGEITTFVADESRFKFATKLPEHASIYGFSDVDLGKGSQLDYSSVENSQIKVKNVLLPESAFKGSTIEANGNRDHISRISKSFVNDTHIDGPMRIDQSNVNSITAKNGININNSQINGGNYQKDNIKNSIVWATPTSIINNSELTNTRIENRSLSPRDIKRENNVTKTNDNQDVLINDTKLTNAQLMHDRKSSSYQLDNSNFENVITSNGGYSANSTVKGRQSKPVLLNKVGFENTNLDRSGKEFTKGLAINMDPDAEGTIVKDNSISKDIMQEINPKNPAYKAISQLDHGHYNLDPDGIDTMNSKFMDAQLAFSNDYTGKALPKDVKLTDDLEDTNEPEL